MEEDASGYIVFDSVQTEKRWLHVFIFLLVYVQLCVAMEGLNCKGYVGGDAKERVEI